MKKSQRVKRNFKVDYNLDWAYSVKISQLREDLDALEKLGVTHVDIEASERYGCAYLDIEAFATRMETEEECKERLSELKRRDDEIKRRDLEQLQKLQDKYKK
jgi:hypothetical protein